MADNTLPAKNWITPRNRKPMKGYMMKTLVVNRNIIVSIFVVILLIYGVQGISYGQGDAPTVTPSETNTCLVVKFQITLDEGVDENAYQIRLRQKSPLGEWISKCIVITRGEVHATGDLGVFSKAKYWGSGGFPFLSSGRYSDKTFNITAIFTNLEPGTIYEARYRDTNLSVCTKTPPSPDPWSAIAEGTTHLVTPPRAEFVDANLAEAVRKELRLLRGEHIKHLKIPEAALAKATDFYSYTSDRDITDLTGLEHASELTYLDLSENQIGDISPLAQLTQLTELYLSENQIGDISPLAQLTQLTELYLSENQIGDISPLAQLTQLTELYLGENQIRDVTPLATLVSLETLSLRDNPITDTSPISRFLRENPNLDIRINIPVIIESGRERDLSMSIYWAEDEKIRKANLASTNVKNLVTGTSANVIALDVAGGKIYWTNGGIQRANLDGTNVENLVPRVLSDGIALDIAGGKIYWTDWGENRVQRANLDGTNVENLFTGLKFPRAMALDIVGSKIYWVNFQEDRVQRANFDGTNVENLVSGVLPYDIALDVAGGKIYWGEFFEIQRANLDGTNVENLVRAAHRVLASDIALDIAGGKIYWTVRTWGYRFGKIQRANFDGADIEDVIIGLNNPSGITLSGSLRFPVHTRESSVPNVENTQMTEPLEFVDVESGDHQMLIRK